jgi:hypothetical protein
LHGLTELHVINRVIACSLTYNRNLAFGEGTRLDYCVVTATTDNYVIVIITLGRLYFMLSCQLALMPCSCSTGDVRAVVPHVPWSGHTFHQEWARKLFGLGSWWAYSVRILATWRAWTPGPVGTGPAPRTWSAACLWLLSWRSLQSVRTWVLHQTRYLALV